MTINAAGPKAARMAGTAFVVAELSFEAAWRRLEESVRQLEGGEAPLEEAIRLDGEGDGLKRQCEARLQAAQARIEAIQFGPDGAPAGTAPFGGE